MTAWLRFAVVLSAAAMIALAAGFGRRELQKLPRYEVDTSVVALRLGWDWVDDRFAESMAETPLDLGRRSIYDRTLLAELGGKLAANPWVRRVEHLARVHPCRIRIDVELRQPAAAVRHESALYLVDRDSVRLAGTYEEIPETVSAAMPGFPLLTGVGGPPPPAAGTCWRSDGIAMGFAVADLLRSRGVYERLAVHEIDVSYNDRYEDRVVTLIAGVHRTPVTWGKSPLNPDPIDAPSELKLAHLEKLLRYSPGLAGLVTASIAGMEVSYREAPAPGPAPEVPPPPSRASTPSGGTPPAGHGGDRRHLAHAPGQR